MQPKIVLIALFLLYGCADVPTDSTPSGASPLSFGRYPLATAPLEWVERTDDVGVPNRGADILSPDAVYDSRRQVLVRFAHPETWEYDGTQWTRIPTSVHPPALIQSSMTYDRRREVVILFGGRDFSGNLFDETWEYDGTDWRRVFTTISPPARASHELAFDSKRGVTVLFGGSAQFAFQTFTDTWEYDGSDWQKVVTSTAPAGRLRFDMSYSETREATVLHGGFQNRSGFFGSLSDAWEFDGTNWTQLPAGPNRSHHGLVFNPADGYLYLFGGVEVSLSLPPPFFSTQFSDTWRFDGSTWQPVSTLNDPTPRHLFSHAFDRRRSTWVVQGGLVRETGTNSVTDETWELSFSLRVLIDIKPDSDPNSINCRNQRGLIPVAILSTKEFDAMSVDHSTVTFEEATEIHSDRRSGVPRRHEEDVDGDGDTDLVFHFRFGDTELTCDSLRGTVTGETVAGQKIEGTDFVRMIG